MRKNTVVMKRVKAALFTVVMYSNMVINHERKIKQ
jgi:hypothetical protein